MAWNTYNPNLVNSIFSQIQSSYDGLMRVIGDTFQAEVVNDMATGWFAPEAQTCFQNAKAVVDELLSSTTQKFESLGYVINQAARIWAESCKMPYTDHNLNLVSKTIDISAVKEISASGDRGIIPPTVIRVQGALNRIPTDVNTLVEELKTKVASFPAFEGGSQMTNLNSTISSISSSVSSGMTTISNEVKNKLDSTVEKYTIIARSAANL